MNEEGGGGTGEGKRVGMTKPCPTFKTVKMRSIEEYDAKLRKWVPYVPDYEKRYRHGSRFMIRSSRFTIHGSRFAVHGSQFTVYDSRFTVHDLQLTGHDSQFTIHD